MDNNMQKCINEVNQRPGVTGVVCSDSNGLILSSSGNVNSQAAGAVLYLTNQALLLEPENNDVPVVTVESDKSHILMKKEGNISIAVFKSNTYS